MELNTTYLWKLHKIMDQRFKVGIRIETRVTVGLNWDYLELEVGFRLI